MLTRYTLMIFDVYPTNRIRGLSVVWKIHICKPSVIPEWVYFMNISLGYQPKKKVGRSAPFGW